MADKSDNKPEQGEAPAPAAGHGRKRMLAFAAALLFCVGSSVAVGILAFPAGHGAPVEPQKPKQPAETVEVPVPQILVNLDGEKAHSLLQATVTLEVIPVGHETKVPDIGKMLPPVQDRLIKLLSSFKREDLTGGASKEFIQTRIKDSVSELTEKRWSVKVVNVYFLEFVIQ